MTKAFHRTDPFAEFGLRAVALWARRDGARVERVDDSPQYSSADVDLLVERGGKTQAVKVKTDSYFGGDARYIEDQDLPYYRRRAEDFALETISHHITREPGWMFNSEADSLWYYQAVLLNTKVELERALELDDEEMLAALDVDGDRLRVVPMQPLRQWFDAAHVDYPPRPVQVGDHISWYRIIPAPDIESAVGSVEGVNRLLGSL